MLEAAEERCGHDSQLEILTVMVEQMRIQLDEMKSIFLATVKEKATASELEEEIDRLVAEGMISAVEHSEWVAPIVVVEKKNGKIRLCTSDKTKRCIAAA
ncbi:unnamed protein product [Strongylus vulgaris]|uniref:Reverse transcriptase/retrotransposon-derived protein RNase H-like domain-containing protein n=1 Tax=Strongylus vulgaris TaxID=40348 RepID=A0A3P7HZU7_STRVU|nr:unnamed protein product [Strongylus vulgaris]